MSLQPSSNHNVKDTKDLKGTGNSIGIDARAVPVTRIDWPTAMRLRAVRLPMDDALKSLSNSPQSFQALNELADLSDQRHRVLQGSIGHEKISGLDRKANVYSGLFYQSPEWLFNDGKQSGLVFSKNLQAALSHTVEMYSRFLRDCNSGPTTMQFIVDRVQLSGPLHDLTDTDSFGSLYQSDDWSVPQATSRNLLNFGSHGFVYGLGEANHAVVFDPYLTMNSHKERAVALQWTGQRFSKLFDYRDLYWKEI